ncbi:hypothetical protein KP509_31G006100 [Ceratopteris richardii]|uniref:FO synthase n=1 Tax=Ceratopteris richardii TaxID=49495 RepID=A0A8T2QV44_CERRI|nr:hypothetical protein KP509_31G006100 [Ceratopteris richardii]
MELAAHSVHGLSDRQQPTAHACLIGKKFRPENRSLFLPRISRRLLGETQMKLTVRADVPKADSSNESMNGSFALDYLERMKQGTMCDQLDEHSVLQVAELDVKALISAASEVRDRGPYHHIISFSPKVFIPLTRACRDSCTYCTFALAPTKDQKIYMSVDEVLDIARKGVAVGCTEALFTLGDKPELLYPKAKEELATLGHPSTISYVAEVARIVLEQTGLLPHLNVGVMSRPETALLRRVSVSQGLMLETISRRLLKPGRPHYQCPDKVPAARLATIRAAGIEKVPFTSGLLIGIGESRKERIQSLLELHKLHKEYGHIQELIIQNFCAKKGTPMEHAAEPSLEELQWTIAMARLIFGPSMNIQAPPNLTPRESTNKGDEWIALIQAGINDWGGISPVTKDWVNPEAPWPHLSYLAEITEKAGKVLVPRLAIYPHFVQNSSKWLDSCITSAVLKNSNSLGFARGEAWSPGISTSSDSFKELCYSRKSHFISNSDPINSTSLLSSNEYPSSEAAICVGITGKISITRDSACTEVTAHSRGDISFLLDRAMAGDTLLEEEIVQLFSCMGEEFEQICRAADQLRTTVNGNKVTYVINRNINYTNVCSYKCQFCAFSKGKFTDTLRGKPYLLPLEEIARRAYEAWDRGATEICMQGGIHPEFTGETYLNILCCVKSAVPDVHVHAFSPLEVWQGAKTLGLSIYDYLLELRKAGLGSIPGTAAEILDDRIRDVLCPDKLTTQEWLEVMQTAHSIGLKSTSTIMFGHLDSPHHWAKHLLHLRSLQRETGGFTEFVPLPFIHMEAPLFLKGKARRGPTRRECLLMHAIARLVLHPYITNIQASWVKMGPSGAQALLFAGCNDMGGTLMNESITRAAGASHGEELPPLQMEALIRSIGRDPEQRTTLYSAASPEQVKKSFAAGPLQILKYMPTTG